MFNQNIKNLASENKNFRKVVSTGKYSQLVVMSIPPGEDIGNEVHETIDQILFIVAGVGKSIINNSEEQEVGTDFAFFVPAGTWHNFINTGSTDLKLFTIYSPPGHKDGTVHTTKEEAEKDENDHY